MPTPNVHNGLSILDDMFSDGADDIVLFYRTFDHIALAPALRRQLPIGDVVGPQQILKRRSDQINMIYDMLLSMLSDMVLELSGVEDEPQSFYEHAREIFERLVHRCTDEAMSLDGAIQKEFSD